MAKVKYKERILKAARAKQRVSYKGILIRLSADFSKEVLQEIARYIQSLERKKTYNLGYSTHQDYHLE